MEDEILKPTININNCVVTNEKYRDWMTIDSDLSKAIYHLSKSINYLMVWGEIEENIGKVTEFSKSIECFCNQVSYINDELIDFIDNNLDIIEIEKSLRINEKK